MRPRKAHTKSRTGCVECRRRHIKCDESRPQCKRCRNSARECAFTTGELKIQLSSYSPHTWGRNGRRGLRGRRPLYQFYSALRIKPHAGIPSR
ncbi:hypothetical protein BO82DRAFT_74916 [Aspergillus uvarum CBS 121591]|uniref:Zn(2)-C6 fungal-type domain-containing protein n=1 Tax=Aspergillus uvarum CBS 121591 TaxID=1448315 RepID=A0A319CDN1_9EURO|nr:hypothetical protein BO82DRAFT_74916 [Aspergillus uvarum CBS 121591]PYH81811.1 hypothetical protein BO82DRAFT_74916 [Aspergillus uvarum CBS 121591]